MLYTFLMKNVGLRIAIRKAGGMRALARELGLTYQAIQDWDEVPARWLLMIEAKTGVSRGRLRPDLYRDWEPKRTKELEPA